MFSLLQTLIWSSLTPTVATVDESGLIRGIALGLAFLRVDAHGITSSEIPSQFVSVQVAGVDFGTESVSLKPGEEYTFEHLTTYPQTIPIYWSSSDESIATVNDNGVIHGLSDGTCVISAKIGYGEWI